MVKNCVIAGIAAPPGIGVAIIGISPEPAIFTAATPRDAAAIVAFSNPLVTGVQFCNFNCVATAAHLVVRGVRVAPLNLARNIDALGVATFIERFAIEGRVVDPHRRELLAELLTAESAFEDEAVSVALQDALCIAALPARAALPPVKSFEPLKWS